jgi:hypothetical protein
VCLCTPPQPVNSRMAEPIVMKLCKCV